MMTKNVGQEKVDRFMIMIGQEWRRGRAAKGLEVAEDVHKVKKEKENKAKKEKERNP